MYKYLRPRDIARDPKNGGGPPLGAREGGRATPCELRTRSKGCV